MQLFATVVVAQYHYYYGQQLAWLSQHEVADHYQ